MPTVGSGGHSASEVSGLPSVLFLLSTLYGLALALTLLLPDLTCHYWKWSIATNGKSGLPLSIYPVFLIPLRQSGKASNSPSSGLSLVSAEIGTIPGTNYFSLIILHLGVYFRPLLSFETRSHCGAMVDLEHSR